MTMDDWGFPITGLIIDHEGAIVNRVGPMAPNMNAFAERFVRTHRTECLDHFVVCGEKHLQHLVKEFLVHYHDERPYQGRGNVPLCVADADGTSAVPFGGKVECRERLGGLLKHYYRVAA
jgi:putative transposase